MSSRARAPARVGRGAPGLAPEPATRTRRWHRRRWRTGLTAPPPASGPPSPTPLGAPVSRASGATPAERRRFRPAARPAPTTGSSTARRRRTGAEDDPRLLPAPGCSGLGCGVGAHERHDVPLPSGRSPAEHRRAPTRRSRPRERRSRRRRASWPCRPMASTDSFALLHANMPPGQDGTYQFEYGTTSSYGALTEPKPLLRRRRGRRRTRQPPAVARPTTTGCSSRRRRACWPRAT